MKSCCHVLISALALVLWAGQPLRAAPAPAPAPEAVAQVAAAGGHAAPAADAEPAANHADRTPAAPKTVAVNAPSGFVPRQLLWIAGTGIGVSLLLTAIGWFARTGIGRWTIRRRLSTGFAVIFVVITGIAGAGYLGLHQAYLSFTEYRADARQSNLAGRIQANFLEMRLAAKDLVIFQKEEAGQRYAARKTVLSELLQESLREFQDPERLAKLKTISDQVTEHAALELELAKAVAAGQNGKAAEINQRMGATGTAVDHEIEALKLALLNNQNRLGPLVQAMIRETQTAVTVLGLGAIVLGLGLGYFITRSITAPLRVLSADLSSGADQTTTAAAQLAEASQQLASGATEQSASLEETGASLEEMTSMVRRNAEAASAAKTLAAETRSAAETGAARMTEMQQAMDSIKGSSDNVAKILKSIDEIAFQTNILALNAAVEAARAGEAGAGFAVVAEEVRNLAQRSAAAAKETAQMIEACMSNSGQGLEISGKVAESLREITGKVREMDSLVAEIANACQEQSQGVSQINTAVSEIDKVTQSNASSAEESASASAELTAQAQAVNQHVQTLERLTGGSHRSPESAPAAAAPRPQRQPPVAAARSGRCVQKASEGRTEGKTSRPARPTAQADGPRVPVAPVPDDAMTF